MILLLIFLIINAKIRAETFEINDDICGRRANKTAINYIIGGQNAIIEEFPFMVSLQMQNGDSFYEHFCGASIISDSWLLTAAHCINGIPMLKSPSQLKALVGTTYVKQDMSMTSYDGANSYKIEKWIVHGCYQTGSVFNADIALLKTTEPIRASIRGSVCLPPFDGKPISDEAIALGWGIWKPFSLIDLLFRPTEIPKPDLLQKIEIKLYSTQLCNTLSTFRTFGILNDRTAYTICVKRPDASICMGDSGGPIVQKHDGRYYQIGIASYNVGICTLNYQTYYTQLSHYVEWIRKSIKLYDNYYMPADKITTKCE